MPSLEEVRVSRTKANSPARRADSKLLSRTRRKLLDSRTKVKLVNRINSRAVLNLAEVRARASPTRASPTRGQSNQGQAQQASQQTQSGQGSQANGQQIYAQQCAQCHGNNGGGGIGPALAGDQKLQDPQAIITQILNGGGGMPAFADQLSNAEIAAVATHERTSWGNSFGQISADQVAQQRQGGQQAQSSQQNQQQGQSNQQSNQASQQAQGQQNSGNQQSGQNQSNQQSNQQNQSGQSYNADLPPQQSQPQPGLSGSLMYAVEATTRTNVDAKPTTEGVYVCPGINGGVEWYGPTFSPATSTLFVNAVDWCSTFTLGELRYTPGEFFFGGSFSFEPISKSGGWLRAFDAQSGQKLWEYHSERPLVAAATPTAGGVVFTGELTGNFLAVDAASGNVLYRFNTGGPIGGGISTYEMDGKQYVAVASGNASRTWSPNAGASATMFIFALPD